MAKLEAPGSEVAVDAAPALGNSEKAEWVSLMCLIAKYDRDLYRQLRAEAWDSVYMSGVCSTNSN